MVEAWCAASRKWPPAKDRRPRFSGTRSMTDNDTECNRSDEQDDRSVAPRYQSEAYLREQYVEKRRSQQAIADECGVCQRTVQYWVERYSLEQRRRYKDENWMRTQYTDNRLMRDEIADECGVSESTISRWLNIHGIERDPLYQDAEWLHEQYVEKRRDQRAIAEECGVAKTTICHWLARHGITDGESMSAADCQNCGAQFRYYPSVRDGQYCSNECSNETRRNRVELECDGCGETFRRRASLGVEYCSLDCWGETIRVDTSDYYSSYWRQMRNLALARDNHNCVVCGISDETHRRQFGRGLDVHHIVPVRLFKKWERPQEDAHSLRNLVTVCRTHHPDSPGETVDWNGDIDLSDVLQHKRHEVT